MRLSSSLGIHTNLSRTVSKLLQIIGELLNSGQRNLVLKTTDIALSCDIRIPEPFVSFPNDSLTKLAKLCPQMFLQFRIYRSSVSYSFITELPHLCQL